LIKKKRAETPKNYLTKRRKEFSQNAEKILAKTPKNAMIMV
jgi:hypothetical protein